MTKTKLKILCLHGFRQNSAIFKDRLGGFRRFTKNEAEFEFVTAPHKVENEEGSKEDVDERGWWFQRESNDHFRGAEPGKTSRGFEESVQTVEEHVASHGPYDGLLGFSQGAALVGMLCALQSQNNLRFKVNFAIMISGFKSKCIEHEKMYQTKVEIQSLHVFGEQDKFISIEMSESLVAMFDNPVVMRHSGGHHVPSSGPQKNFYKDTYKHFLQSCLVLKDDIDVHEEKKMEKEQSKENSDISSEVE
ncbi:unnamed protein product, partial [Meganyctiphanes norvegica]